MSTRSRIGIVNEDGSVESIYSHWDGYPSHHGPLLLENYKTEEKVRKLISLGSISHLDENVEPDHRGGKTYRLNKYGTPVMKNGEYVLVDAKGKHTFDRPQVGVVVAYHRDRGENWADVAPLESRNKDAFLFMLGHGWEAWGYLYDCKTKKWLFCRSGAKRMAVLTKTYIKRHQ